MQTSPEPECRISVILVTTTLEEPWFFVISRESATFKMSSIYVLTDPVICSSGGRFGATDLGQAGIDNFFAHHKYNHVCQKGGWGLPPGRKVHFKAVAGTTFAQGLSLPARPPDPPAPPPAQSEMMLLLLAAIVLARARA